MSIQWNMSDSVRRSDRLALEQLWYTWSTIGLGPLSAGFRIRAASPGLSDVSSPHVRALDRYLRYVLPTGTDPFAITPDMAPVCLSLIQTEQGERILVNKTYTGRDGVGRPGAFFVHLLSNLPADFSASQAISLWRSPFLRSSDIDPHSGTQHSDVQLEAIPFDELKQWFPRDVDIMHPRGISSSWMQECFPRAMRAYLMWRSRWEQWRSAQQSSEPPRFYIAAPSDMVAALIAGITRCLPPQLLADLTFSTYEHDVSSKDQVLLVGTGWAPSSGDETNTRQDLPAVCYQEGVAINCYSYDDSKTRLENNPLAISFATYALQCLQTGNMRELDWLFSQKTAQFSHLSVAQFLQIYDSYIVKAQNPTQRDVELYIESADADMLSRLHVQDLLLRLATDDPRWLKNFLLPQLNSLSKLSTTTNPMLADSLTQLARAASLKTASAVSSDNVAAFEALLSVMSSVADVSPEAWRIQPGILAAEANIQRFLAYHSSAHFTLLSRWSQLRPPLSSDEIRPFLTIQEPYFEDFYSRNLRPEWKAIATLTLVSSAIDQNTVPQLGQKHQNAVVALLQQRAQTSWFEAMTLFEKLARGGYPTKIYLLSILLDAASSSGKERELFNKASLKESEKESFLIQLGPRYLSVAQKESCILEQFKAFATSAPTRKMLVLESWLKSQELATWFESLPSGPGNMEKVLRAASLTADESNRFVESYGKHYLERYSQKFPTYRLPPLITDYLKQYIASFNPHSLWQSASSAREVLLFLGNSPLLQLLQDREQQKVLRLCDFYSFLQHPSTRLTNIKKFGTILQELRYRDAELIEKLAQTFASCVVSETELASITSMMGTLLSEVELLQMLYSMAEIIRDSMISSQSSTRQNVEVLLLPYIRFALCFDSVFSSETMKTAIGTGSLQTATQEQLFQQMLLYILMQSLHVKSIASLDKQAKELPFRYCQKWLVYSALLNSNGVHQPLRIPLDYTQPSRSIRPGGRLSSNLDTFLAHPSCNRKELKELGNILADRSTRRKQQLVEKLARAFASYIESETELVGVASIMSIMLPKAELLQLFYSMAESIRDDLMNPPTKNTAELRLEPYVRFILCFDAVCELSPDEYIIFVRSFLDLLLQFADASSLQKVNTGNWPDKLQKRWRDCMPPLYALDAAYATASESSSHNHSAAATMRSQSGQSASTGTRPDRLTRLIAWLNEDAFASSAAKPTQLKKTKKKHE